MGKLTLTDSMIQVIEKMAEGNPGAITCIMQMLDKKDWFALGENGGIMHLLQLDDLGVYGPNLYMLWSDCCGRDMETFELVLRNIQMGEISGEDVHKNLGQGRGTPFQNLKTMEELFPAEKIFKHECVGKTEEVPAEKLN